MKNYTMSFIKKIVLGIAVLSSSFIFAGAIDDPVLTTVIIDQFEYSENDGVDTWALNGQGWIGKDLKKLWFKTEAEYSNSELEELEVQALYSKAIAPFWDVQFGIRQDFKPDPSRAWGVIGVQGLAPYLFELDAALFIGESGRTAARLDAEYEILLSQQWILSPEVEVNAYGQDDLDLGIGSGLSDASVGLRLRYEFKREFAVYGGIEWRKKFGNTADIAELNGESDSDSTFLMGIRAWF